MGRHPRIAALVLVVVASGAFGEGLPSLRSVRVVSEGAVTSVIVEADGSLPSPRVGVLPDPPRIYLDFQGTATVTNGVRVDGNPVVRGVRVAINQADPLVTRLVVDLVHMVPHRIDVHLRDRGQVTILLGASVQTTSPPAQTAPAAATPKPPPPSQAATPPPASRPHAAAPTVPAGPVQKSQPPVQVTPAAPTPKPPPPAQTVPSTPAPKPPAVPAAPAKKSPPAQPAPAAATPKPQPPAQTAPAPPVPRPAQPTPVTPAPKPQSPPQGVPAAQPPTAQAAAAPRPVPSQPGAPPGNPPPRTDVLEDSAVNARASTAAAPAKDVEKYLRRGSPVIERLERARPVLVSLDALAALPDEQLKRAADEFDSIRAALTAIEPPRSLKTTHELLCRACELGAMAARTSTDRTAPDAATKSLSAASAAAGAMMLLDRARAELGLPAIRR